MTSVFLDPNYEPERSYPMVEGLLLLFPKVYAYAPNAVAIDRARTHDQLTPSQADFHEYMKKGLLIPIARSWYWDREQRGERQDQILREGEGSAESIARARLFGWTEFDEQIRAMAVHENRQVEIANYYRDLPEKSADVLRLAEEAIGPLYRSRRLPAEFYEDEYRVRPPSYLYGQVLHHFMGDAATCGLRGIEARVLPHDARDLAAAITRIALMSGSRWAQASAHPSSATEDIVLKEDDFRIASEFATRLAKSRYVGDILDDYHRSQFSRAFRLWVGDVLRTARANGQNLERALEDRFRDAVTDAAADRRNVSRATGALAGGALSYAATKTLESEPRTRDFLHRVLGRRELIKGLVVMTGAGLGVFAGETLGERAPVVLSKLRTLTWVDLISSAPRRGL